MLSVPYRPAILQRYLLYPYIHPNVKQALLQTLFKGMHINGFQLVITYF